MTLFLSIILFRLIFENNNLLYEDDNTVYYFEITGQGVAFGITAELLGQYFIKN